MLIIPFSFSAPFLSVYLHSVLFQFPQKTMIVATFGSKTGNKTSKSEKLERLSRDHGPGIYMNAFKESSVYFFALYHVFCSGTAPFASLAFRAGYFAEK